MACLAALPLQKKHNKKPPCTQSPTNGSHTDEHTKRWRELCSASNGKCYKKVLPLFID